MDKQPLLSDQLRKLEEKLLKPEFRKSLDELDALIADDFTEFGSSGRMYDRQEMIDALQGSQAFQAQIFDFQVKLLSADVALATYRIVQRSEGGKNIKYSLRSSIWKKNRDKWQIVFHQGTPAKVE
ncbi:MAG: DUF4440 domain-containing protein [Clostridia bacterium]|nr:DUF4440 domain-containing protein [Clostridia bacterium]